MRPGRNTFFLPGSIATIELRCVTCLIPIISGHLYALSFAQQCAAVQVSDTTGDAIKYKS